MPSSIFLFLFDAFTSSTSFGSSFILTPNGGVSYKDSVEVDSPLEIDVEDNRDEKAKGTCGSVIGDEDVGEILSGVLEHVSSGEWGS